MWTEDAEQLLLNGQMLAARVSRDVDGQARWLAVYPFRVHPELGTATTAEIDAPLRFRVRCFRIRPDLDVEKHDVHEDDLHFDLDQVVHSLPELKEVAQRFISNLSQLGLPSTCDCPV